MLWFLIFLAVGYVIGIWPSVALIGFLMLVDWWRSPVEPEKCCRSVMKRSER